MSFKQEPFTKPGDFLVVVTIAEYPNCGFQGTFTIRVGAAKTIEGAQQLIADDRKAMGDTYGGLIPAVSTKGRTYRVFQSKGWDEVSV